MALETHEFDALLARVAAARWAAHGEQVIARWHDLYYDCGGEMSALDVTALMVDIQLMGALLGISDAVLAQMDADELFNGLNLYHEVLEFRNEMFAKEAV